MARNLKQPLGLVAMVAVDPHASTDGSAADGPVVFEPILPIKEQVAAGV